MSASEVIVGGCDMVASSGNVCCRPQGVGVVDGEASGRLGGYSIRGAQTSEVGATFPSLAMLSWCNCRSRAREDSVRFPECQKEKGF